MFPMCLFPLGASLAFRRGALASAPAALLPPLQLLNMNTTTYPVTPDSVRKLSRPLRALAFSHQISKGVISYALFSPLGTSSALRRGSLASAPTALLPPLHLLNMSTTLLSPLMASGCCSAPPRVLFFYTQDSRETHFHMCF